MWGLLTLSSWRSTTVGSPSGHRQPLSPSTMAWTVPYNYTIAYTPPPLNAVDIVQWFVTSCRAAGIDIGFYYSVVWNNRLNVNSGQVQPGPLSPGQLNITQAA